MEKLPKFSNKKKSFKEKKEIFNIIKEYSKKCGYDLISTSYKNSKTPLTWKNKDGALIITKIGNIRSQGFPTNTNLIKIRRKNKIDFLNDIKKIAESRGGEIISTKYINCKEKVICKDVCGNTFKMTPYDIKNGHWSPYDKCVSEHICRQIIESYFNEKFPQRWDIVKLKGVKKLQLDGYAENVKINNKILKIAFEYQGYCSHRTDKKVIYYDNYKKEFCKNNNIILIVIDKINFKINDEIEFNKHVYNSIKNSLSEDAPVFKPIKINFKINHNLERLKYWREYGEHTGYVLLSDVYIGATSPLKWKSPDGIVFKRSPQTICGSGWPTFSKISLAFMKTKTQFFNEIKEFGIKNGYILLSNEYKDSYNLLSWKSPSGVVFNRSWATIRKDGWPSFNNISMAIINKNNKNNSNF